MNVPDAGNPPPTGPILDRTPDLRHDCSAALGVQRFSERSWGGAGWAHRVIQRADGAAEFARVEIEGPAFAPTTGALVSSTLDAAGTFGTPTVIDDAVTNDVTSVSVIERPAQRLVLYSTPDGVFGADISSGTSGGSKPVLQPGATTQTVRAAASGDRAAVIVSVLGADNRYSVLLQPLDAVGSAAGPSYEVARGAEPFVRLNAILEPTSDGWAVAWSGVDTDGGEINFRRFDTDGNPASDVVRVFTGEASGHRVGRGGSFAGGGVAMVAVDDGFVLAWTEVMFDPDSFDSGTSASIGMAKLDTSGAIVQERALLEAPVIDVEHVEPELFVHGDDIGLTWSKGTVIYLCGGCVPDHEIRMVLLDPSQLIPTSDVVALNDAEAGGLLFRTTSSNGTDVLTAFRLVHHVHSEAGIAAVTCNPR